MKKPQKFFKVYIVYVLKSLKLKLKWYLKNLIKITKAHKKITKA